MLQRKSNDDDEDYCWLLLLGVRDMVDERTQ
jgi:hypothetical protein